MLNHRSRWRVRVLSSFFIVLVSFFSGSGMTPGAASWISNHPDPLWQDQTAGIYLDITRRRVSVGKKNNDGHSGHHCNAPGQLLT
jgi:hypothetical protein